jgi:hypothetical protein
MRQPLFVFNRGRISSLALARVDQKRVAISADVMTNWMPRVLGPMSLRPGLEYLFNQHGNNQAKYIPFIFSASDTALIELTTSIMRVIIDDTPLTRAAVTTAVANDSFTSNLTSWVDFDEGAAVSDWVTGGYMGLTGTGTSAAGRQQQVATVETGTEHALRIEINRGPVTLRVGSSSGGDEYISETSLGTGSHSLAFTPTGNFYILFQSRVKRIVYVDSCIVESAGIVALTSPWTATELGIIRHDQSGDILFASCKGFQQRRIERRATRSWSIVTYQPEDGPFKTENVGPITIAAAAISGNTTLTASSALFKSTNVGGLYRITSDGQKVSAKVDADTNIFTDPIKVTGITSDRIFTINLAGTWAGASIITLQRSLTSEIGPWSDVVGKTWTANTTETYDDGLDNQIVWYQIGCKTGDFNGADDIDADLDYSSGSITGVARVTAYTNATTVSAEIITDLGGTTATDVWAEGVWSGRRGWPSAVAIHEGRLWWAGKDKVIGSISDAFDLFDPDFEGDAGPIQRSIGSGPVDTINWMLSLQRLVLGGDGAEHSARSSSFDEPLTPTNFNMKDASTQGSDAVTAIKLDQRGIYIQRGGVKLYELSIADGGYNYNSNDLTTLVPDMGTPGLVRLAVQRQPDTRIHALRSDGTAMIQVYDKSEEVYAWIDVETDGQIEDVVVMPGSVEDEVYYSVRRTINGSTVRFLEKWAVETDCRGGTLNKQADAFKTYTGAAVTVIPDLSHLEGESVVAWADGKDVGTKTDYSQTYTVNGGQITLAAAASNVVVGLPYTAQWKSAKLAAQADALANALTTKKRVDWIGLILAWVHPKGLRYGQDFDNLENMPEVEGGKTIDPDTIRDSYAEDPILIPGTWLVDTRVCLQAQAPRPCTVQAAVAVIDIGG